MTAPCQATTETAELATTPGSAHRRRVIGIALAFLVLAISACGSGSEESPAADSPAAAEQPAEQADDSAESASPASNIDLTAISDCIAAADIVVAPTSYSDSFLEEQKIAATLDLGALGNEFGGGQLFVFETVARADEMYAIKSEDTDAAVRQDGATLLEYRSAVQDEAADIVMACAAG